jgi:hypothetical protein
MEIALKLDLPIIAVNLNGMCNYDSERCPPILRDKYIAPIPSKRDDIKYASDNFPDEYAHRNPHLDLIVSIRTWCVLNIYKYYLKI